ncbi:SCO1664 family protein [Dehalococcoidia bacterium]|nr:SCO1664 family protein [Dehalococcoidia bacterium]
MIDRPTSTLELLEQGEVIRHKALRSYNHTLLAQLSCGDSRTCMVVYKPRDGEAPLWDFPSKSLYVRERLAYAVSEALGWGLVPLTIIRDGPFGIGSMQLFIESQIGKHYFDLISGHKDSMLRIAVFDLIINNCDRKGGHTIVDNKGHIWAIDHGLSFLAGSKVRTVMWDLLDEPLSPEIKRAIAMLCQNSQLMDMLSSDLSIQEMQAFRQRVEVLLEAKTLPLQRFSDPYRPFPWPTI